MSAMRAAVKVVISVLLVFCVSISDVSLRLHQFSLLRKVSVTFYTSSRDVYSSCHRSPFPLPLPPPPPLLSVSLMVVMGTAAAGGLVVLLS